MKLSENVKMEIASCDFTDPKKIRKHLIDKIGVEVSISEIKAIQKELISANVFDFRTIKSFEDACAKQKVDPTALPDVSMIPEDLRKPIISAYKLMIIFLAINNGWRPDWSNSSQGKYYPWYWVLSSGFGFSNSGYDCAYSSSVVGSRLCTDTSEKALYIAEQFEAEYKEYFLYSE